jgi:hypothetical protein
MTDSAAPPAAATAPAAPRSRARRLVGPAAGLAVGVLILALAQTIAEPAIATSLSPRWWPEILGALVCALSIGVGIKEALVAPAADDDEGDEPTRLGMLRVALALAVIVGYGVLWYFVDFRIATLGLVAGLVAVIGGRGWKALILFPVIVTALLYAIFALLLKVPL